MYFDLISQRIVMGNGSGSFGAGSSEYSAFEVFAHDTDIPAGEHEDLGLIRVAVPAGMTHGFYIRSEHLQDKQNVVIDWGDGTLTTLSEFTGDLSGAAGDWRYLVTHTYSATGRYIVRIYGNTYFAIVHNELTPNLMCRVFDIDLPTASHLTNYSSFARGTKLLTSVNMFNAYNFIKNAKNIANMFAGGVNILEVKGFYNSALSVGLMGSLLKSCYRANSDYRIPAWLYDSSAIAQMYYDNYQLQADILDLLPANGFIPGQSISMYQVFKNCKKITCRDFEKLGNILWNNTSINWLDTAETFAGCTDEFRAQVPESWSGTATEEN